MAKPTTLIPWDDNLTNIVIPDTNHQDDGWLAPGGVPEKPPYQYFNHQMNQTTRWLEALSDFYDDVLRLGRSTFAYVSTTQASIAGGAYPHHGTVDQILKIDSTITHTITTPGTSQFQYFYADDSAIVTAGTNVLTGTEIINATTVPTYSITKNGWYNGDDLCIGAVWIDSSGDVEPFYHDGGDFVRYDKEILVISYQPTSNFTDAGNNLTLIMPRFSTRAESTAFGQAASTTTDTMYWRTNGSTNATGNLLLRTPAVVGTTRISHLPMYTDSIQIIEVKATGGLATLLDLYTAGWYFPTGMGI